MKSEDLDKAITASIRRHNVAMEELTELQMMQALKAAIACGDFIRHVHVDGFSQAVTYMPFRREQELVEEAKSLRDAIIEHHSQKADDRCIEDDDKLYKAAGLPPCDRRVGNKEEMLANCQRFIERRCEAGGWPSYAELEKLCKQLAAALEQHHQKDQESLTVYFEQDGKPIDIVTDLGEAYAESEMAEKTADALHDFRLTMQK